MIRNWLVILAVLLLFGCTQAPDHVTFHAEGKPDRLSEWGLFTVSNGRITPHDEMVTYELKTPLFSDYAQKWRTIWMPKGVAAKYGPEKWFYFPVGTIVTKTFYYPTPASVADAQTSDAVLKVSPATYYTGVNGLDLSRVRLIETRLLVKRAGGWVAFPYVWNAEGTDATLERTGAQMPLTLEDGVAKSRFTYSVPNQVQCAGCHAQDARTRAIEPIGLKARHLDRDFPGEGGEINQLRRLVSIGYLTGAPGTSTPRSHGESTEAMARAYLDINCSHCHSKHGPARTSGLWLDAKTKNPRLLGACKPPVAAGRGTGDRSFGIVPGHPEASITTYRMASVEPGEMMPELGRALTHKEGVALIESYIRGMKGSCERR